MQDVNLIGIWEIKANTCRGRGITVTQSLLIVANIRSITALVARAYREAR